MKISAGNVIPATNHTWFEIAQQPVLWPSTPERVKNAIRQQELQALLGSARVILTGAGTSAHIASAIAAGWPKATAVPSTDLLVDTERYIADADVLISIGRSGNSPESMAVVNRVNSIQPEIIHLALTCNSDGALAQSPLIRPILLDPRTDDKSLVMTSSFSNLVIGGYCLYDEVSIDNVVADASAYAREEFDNINEGAKRTAASVRERIVLLASSPMFAWAQEGSLKSLEMTAGRFPVLAETYLGLRHGPMSFVRPDTVVLCLLSNDALRRKYELDLVQELRTKGLGRLVGIGAKPEDAALFDELIPAVTPEIADHLRTPFEMIGPQLLGYHLSLRVGLNPDNPSESGIITRVVEGVRIHQE